MAIMLWVIGFAFTVGISPENKSFTYYFGLVLLWPLALGCWVKERFEK